MSKGIDGGIYQLQRTRDLHLALQQCVYVCLSRKDLLRRVRAEKCCLYATKNTRGGVYANAVKETHCFKGCQLSLEL